MEDGGKDFGSKSACDGAWDSDPDVVLNLRAKRLHNTSGVACAPLSFMSPIVFAMVHLGEELHDETVVGDCNVQTPPDLPRAAKVEHCCLAELPVPEISGLDLPLVPVAEENVSNRDITRRNYK